MSEITSRSDVERLLRESVQAVSLPTGLAAPHVDLAELRAGGRPGPRRLALNVGVGLATAVVAVAAVVVSTGVATRESHPAAAPEPTSTLGGSDAEAALSSARGIAAEQDPAFTALAWAATPEGHGFRAVEVFRAADDSATVKGLYAQILPQGTVVTFRRVLLSAAQIARLDALVEELRASYAGRGIRLTGGSPIAIGGPYAIGYAPGGQVPGAREEQDLEALHLPAGAVRFVPSKPLNWDGGGS